MEGRHHDRDHREKPLWLAGYGLYALPRGSGTTVVKAFALMMMAGADRHERPVTSRRCSTAALSRASAMASTTPAMLTASHNHCAPATGVLPDYYPTPSGGRWTTTRAG